MTEPKKQRKLLGTVKAPLLFALILGLVAGVVTTIAASGGTGSQIQSHGTVREIRIDLGAIAFGVAFIASLVVLAMLSLTFKENPEHLSEGSGISRRSEDRLRERESRAHDRAESGSDPAGQHSSGSSGHPSSPSGQRSTAAGQADPSGQTEPSGQGTDAPDTDSSDQDTDEQE